jgi:hypothetical protein
MVLLEVKQTKMENSTEQHSLVLEKTYGTGAEEWYCPTCGRRFVMVWSPVFKRIILESGDEYAVHSGGKGIPGMVVPQLGVELNNSSQDDESISNDEQMAPWLDWFESSDFENLWDDENP